MYEEIYKVFFEMYEELRFDQDNVNSYKSEIDFRLKIKPEAAFKNRYKHIKSGIPCSQYGDKNDKSIKYRNK